MYPEGPHPATRLANAIYLAALLVFLALLVHNHVQIIAARVPIDYYEGAMLHITGVIAAGQNPYTFGLQPTAADVYPPLYNLVVAPLSHLFGNTLQLHRTVAGFFILMSCVLAFRATRKAGGSTLNSIAAAAMLYAALLFYATPIASTNGIGMFLFMASVLVPWERGFSSRSLAAAIACGVLAFYSKQYFLVGPAFVCAYLFIAVSKRKAVVFGMATAVTVIGSVIIVQMTSPYFLDNTVFSVAYAIGLIGSSAYLPKQLLFFGQTYLAVLLLLALVALYSLWRTRNEVLARLGSFGFGGLARLGNFDEPLVQGRPNYFWFCFTCATMVIVLVLGRNPGNYVTYLFQLMSPFLLIATFSLQAMQLPLARLLLPLILFGFYKAYIILPRDFAVDMKGWKRVDALMQANDQVLASPILIAALIKNHKTVYQNGHTFYFPMAAKKPAFLQPADASRRVDVIWNTYIRGLYKDVKEKKFGCVLLNDWDLNGIFLANPPPDLHIDGRTYFKQFYRRSGAIPVSMPKRPGGGTRVINVWVPK